MKRNITPIREPAYPGSKFGYPLTIVFLLMLLPLCYVSASNTDSLVRAYKSHSLIDTVKVKLAIDLGWAYQDVNMDSAFFYTREAEAMAVNNGFGFGYARAYEQFGDLYDRSGQADKSILFYTKSLRAYLNQQNRPRAAIILKCMGGVYYGKFEFARALDCYLKSLKMVELLNNQASIASLCNNIGATYKELGKYHEALQYYYKGLRQAEKLNQEETMAMMSSNIAIVYTNLGKYKESFDYANQALAISKRINNPLQEIHALSIIGRKYTLEKDYEESVTAYKRALAIAISLSRPDLIALASEHIGDNLLEQKKYDEAISYYKQGIRYSEQVNNLHYLSQAYSQLGKTYMLKGNKEAGIQNLEKGLAVARQTPMPTVEVNIRHELAHSYEKNNDYRKAYQHLSGYTALRDSMYKVDEKSAMQQLHFDHELYKKRQEIILLENEKTIQAERDKNQRILLLFLVTVLCFAGVIIYFLVSGSQKRKRAMKLIAAQKLEIQSQAVHLKQLNDLKTRTFSIISHDLRNPIAALSMLIELMDKNLISNGNFFEAMQGINGQLYSLNTVLENLLIWSKNQMEGREEHNPSKVDLHMLAEQSIALLREGALQKKITLVNDIAQNTAVLADNEHVDIVIRNLVANAIKFTKENGRVTVSSQLQGDRIKVMVKDTGVGMSQATVGRLFSYTETVTNYGTKGEKGTGLGLLICKEFIEKSGGTISVESEEGKGSCFFFDLPKAG